MEEGGKMKQSLFDAIMACAHSGDDSLLRATPEGRAFLLGVAKDRRKTPLAVRRMPRLMCEAASKYLWDGMRAVMEGGR